VSLTRRTPLRSKRAKPRRRAVTCTNQRCRRSPSVLGLCRTHATIRADQLVGDFVKARDGGCVVDGPHSGALQWSHLISRRYHATRWNLDVSVGMCAGHHYFFTTHPLQFEVWIEERLGLGYSRELKSIALSGERPDLEDIIRTYETAAA
jgi:hypothetical protein